MGETLEVTGIPETLRALQQIEPKLKFKAINKAKAAAKPMAEAMASNFPGEPPLSGMGRGRDGVRWKGQPKLDIKYRNRAPKWYSGRSVSVWNLFSIYTPKGWGGVVQFDTAEGGSFGERLSRRWGAPSRAMWRISEQMRQDTAKAMAEAVDEVAKDVNKDLSKVKVY